jgi:2-methylisocitrate lyase-like PEP mutase family enzyme
MIDHCREIVGATDLPVSADLEKGKGNSPESAAETIFAAEAAGLAGCSIEDFSGDPKSPIYDFEHAVERVAAAAEAARAVERDFVLTARSENFLWDRPDVEDTVRRLQAFDKAGADVLYAPAISDIETIRQICAAVSKPVNVLALAGMSVAELSDAGVRRISLGSRLTNYAFGAVKRACDEIQSKGTFDFSREAMPFADIQNLMAGKA